MKLCAYSFSKIQNPSLRTAAAMALFGKSGAALIPMLIDGRSAIEEFEGTANRLGLVLNPDDMRRVEVFSDNVSTLMQAIHGLARAIAVQVIPHLDPLVTKMTEWVAANRQLIATRAGEFIEQLAGWLQRIDFDAVLQGITDFVAGVQRVVDWLGGWSNALTILALGMTGLLGPMISVAGGTAQVAIGLTRLLPGLAAATGGFARFGLRVAALAVGLGGRLALALVGLVPALGALIPPLLSVGAAILATPIGWILAGIAALAAAVYLIVDNWSTLGEFFSGLWDGIKGLFGGLVGWFADIGGRLIGGLWDGVKSAWGSFWGWISDAIGGLLRLIGAPMAALTGMAVNAVTGGGAAPPASSAFVGGNQAAAASLLPAMPSTRAQVGGEMVVRFENPPEGMTVKSATSDTPGLTFRPDLGPAFGIA